MATLSPEQIRSLLERPTESLNIELKTWISPTQPDGMAKIVRACFAIYNRNGGYLQIGFDDVTRQQDTKNVPEDIRGDFRLDAIQGLISAYASRRFEINVEFGTLNGIEHPIIVIPSGVRTIVAVKSDLFDAAKKPLLRVGEVYFRTLNSNGTPSSARVRPDDWSDILEICLDNREADFGRFLRRNVPDTVEKMREAFFGGETQTRPTTPSAWESSPQAQGPSVAEPTLSERTTQVLDDGIRRFDSALRHLTPSQQYGPPKYGRWSTSLIVDPAFEDVPPTREFLRILGAANPNLTGWPVWLDSSTVPNEEFRPKVIDGAWQTLIASFQGWSRHVEFHRLEPKGHFFLSRVLQDDLRDEFEAGAVLDPILMIYRVTEAMAVGLAFAKALGASVEAARLGFRFRWAGLANRQLSTWANPMVIPFLGSATAHDAGVEDFVEVPLDTALTSLAPYTQRATRKLFSAFDGTVIADQVIEKHVRRLIERNLS